MGRSKTGTTPPDALTSDAWCVMIDTMRTTLDLDEDILQAAKEIAALRRTTTGKVLSELARKALTPAEPPLVRNGVPVLPRRPPGSPRLTMKLVNEMRDEV
jgi:hypothetical protein